MTDVEKISDIDTSWWTKYKVDVPEGESGEWSVERFNISEQQASFTALRAAIKGDARHACFPGTYTRLMHGSELVMSDTFAEIMDHMEPMMTFGMRNVERVLINGLGLGMVLRQALGQKHIKRVDVVELSQDVIDLVGPHYQDPRLVIHQGDALTIKFPPHTRWDVVWHDIWSYVDEDNRQEMITLHRRYGGRATWQGSWSRADIEGGGWGKVTARRFPSLL